MGTIDHAESLLIATRQLKDMFSNTHELKGFDDWDKFIGCIVMIENVANDLKEESKAEPDTEKTEDEKIS